MPSGSPDWLVPCGAMAAVIVGSWLVEAKQSVIENMAPVLTRLFTPLFTLVLLVFLATMVWTGSPIDVKREVLIAFDLLLALVVGLVLYAASARDSAAHRPISSTGCSCCWWSARSPSMRWRWRPSPRASPSSASRRTAWRRWARISSCWSTSRDRPGSTRASCARRGSFAALERWQIAYLPVYSVWAAFVVVVFPPLFGFR